MARLWREGTLDILINKSIQELHASFAFEECVPLPNPVDLVTQPATDQRYHHEQRLQSIRPSGGGVWRACRA